MTPAAPTVTVIIPTWNGKELLPMALRHVDQQDYCEYSVTVVDNGSTDGSLEYLAEEWPGVNVIALGKNYGFARAVNAGIAASSADYVALLNNDVEVEPDWLRNLVSDLQAHPRAASASGKLLSYANRDVIDVAGLALNWHGYGTPRGRGERDMGQYDVAEFVVAACGGAGLYRRSAFARVGPFDEEFFAYYEDLDWGLRAQLLGFTSRYVPSAVVYHMGGASSRRMPAFQAYLGFRNALIMITKDFPGASLARHAHHLAYMLVRVAATSIRQRSFRAFCIALVHVAAQSPQLLKSRRAIQSSRSASQADLDAVISHHAPPSRTVQRIRGLAAATMRRIGGHA